MDENFELAFKFTVTQEGGYVNDTNDLGGETKYGISKRSYPYIDIKKLTLEDAKKIYFEDFWVEAACHLMPIGFGLSVFDMAVNSGVEKAIKTLQVVLEVDVDGVVGPQTLDAMDPSKMLLFNVFRILNFTNLIGFKRFGKGWITRVVELISYIIKEEKQNEIC